MAALTRAEQGNHPAMHQMALGTEVMGEDEWIGIFLTAPPLTMARLAWVRPPLPAAHLLAIAKVLPPLEPLSQRAQGSIRGKLGKKEPVSLQCFRCLGWGHMAWECAILAKCLNLAGGEPRNVAQPPTANSRHPAIPP